MTNMPKIDRSRIGPTTHTIKNIINIVVKKNGIIRSTKPKIVDDMTGKAAYVWRMVCFFVSPKPAHQCMPVTATFSLPAYDDTGKWRPAIARNMAKDLDTIVDIIVNAIDKKDWHGVQRWNGLI